jgi:hypothetical protein
MDRCTVCYQPECVLNTVPPCRHAYNDVCMKEWIDRHNTCPICVRPLIQGRETPRVLLRWARKALNLTALVCTTLVMCVCLIPIVVFCERTVSRISTEIYPCGMVCKPTILGMPNPRGAPQGRCDQCRLFIKEYKDGLRRSVFTRIFSHVFACMHLALVVSCMALGCASFFAGFTAVNSVVRSSTGVACMV